VPVRPPVSPQEREWRSGVSSRLFLCGSAVNEGHLTDDKRREYETYIHAIDCLAILQAKARALLRRSGDDR
jgi:hypothetical protein